MNSWHPRRQIVGSDLHGKYAETVAIYQQLLDNAFDPRLDQFIITGDIVDFGEDSNKLIQWCINKEKEFNTPEQKHFVFLMGNHESMLLDALNPLHPTYGDSEIWFSQGGDETLKSYNPKLKKLTKKQFSKAKEKPEFYMNPEHIEWIRNLPLLMVDEDYVFCHAGLSDEPIDIILRKLDENNQQTIHDLLWIRNEFIYNNRDWGKRIIYGHTPCPGGEPQVQRNKIGLNTMPRNEGKFSFLEIPSMRFYFQSKL